MIPLLSLLPDAALPGPSLLPARLYSSWYLPRVPDPDLGPGLALREYCRNFRRQNNTETVNVVATDEIMIIAVLQAPALITAVKISYGPDNWNFPVR